MRNPKLVCLKSSVGWFCVFGVGGDPFFCLFYFLKFALIPWLMTPSILKASKGQLNLAHITSL